MPRVSVVIPAHDAEATIDATLRSVLAQTFQDFEVLVVDDGSADATRDAARAYGAPVSCITTPNRGVAEARNLGIVQTDGEYVAFLDADDLWEPEKLERQVSLLDRRPEAGISTTGCRRVDSELRVLEDVPARAHPDPCEALLLYSMILGPISSPLVRRRELAEDLGGFDPRLSQCADWDFFIRASRLTSFAVIEDPLVLYRVSGDSMSRDVALLERDTFAVLDRFFEGEVPARYARLRRRSYSNHWMILSGSYLHAGQRRAAVRCLVNGIRAHPAGLRRPLGLPARFACRARRAHPTVGP